MYFQDLSQDQKNKIWGMLRTDSEVCTQNTIKNRIALSLSKNKLTRLQNEEIDNWINCNNNPKIILDLLDNAYK